MDTNRVPAGEFKQRCLAILDDVAAGNVEVIVTKRGRPVARIVAPTTERDREAAVLKELRGRGRTLVSEAQLLRPLGRSAGWRL